MDIYLSVVSGTYNRLSRLKSMVQSVRKSIGVGIPYEIVLVDGGSTDGSIAWMKSQPDIVLIEQGSLLGAVRAFQAGFAVAKGKYVVVANDDIEFRYESLQNAIAFMEDDPTVGIGCFPQNRYDAQYTVAKMPVVVNGRSDKTWYGQVCIVPKWLGDRVGWWDPGVGYHTYAGDNELSCNVLELGFKVLPMESCCIDDHVEKDALRIKNSVPTGVVHPDSEKWARKWTRNGKLGPVVVNVPKISSPLRPIPRLVYAPLYEDSAFPIHLSTKYGLRKSLSKHFLVSEVNYRKDPEELYYTVSMFKPQVCLIQFQDVKLLSYDLMMKLKDEFRNTKFVSWNGDYRDDFVSSKAYMQIAAMFDIASFVSADASNEYLLKGINFKYWQVSFEEYIALSVEKKEFYDVCFIANCYKPQRQSIGEMLRLHRDWKTLLYGAWPSHIKSDGACMYDFAKGDQIYRSSKIAISDNMYQRSVGYCSNRLFQAMHSGAFVLQQRIPGMEQLLGLEDGVHLAIWENIADLQEKIQFWLDHSSERREIARNGKEFIDKFHSFDKRIDELLGFLKELPDGSGSSH